MSGIFSNLHGSSESIVAGIIATAAFLAPQIVTSPVKGLPPFITNLTKDYTPKFQFLKIKTT